MKEKRNASGLSGTTRIKPRGKKTFDLTVNGVKKKIRDANKAIKIRVRPEDVEKSIGHCKDHQKCVVACAIKRAKKAQWVDVGAGRVLVEHLTRGLRYTLDGDGKEVVRFFDTHKGVAGPTIVVLKPMVKKIGTKTYTRSYSRKKTTKRRVSTR